MTLIKNKIKTGALIMAAAIFGLTACNKEVEEITGTPVTPPTGLSLGETLAATPDDSLFNRMVVKAGMAATLSNKSLGYTLFVPNNAAVIASFGGSLASAIGTINALPAASLAGIVKYNMIPQKLASAQVVHGFPNMQMPTDIILDPTNPLIRMTSFPSKSGTTGSSFYYNNAPLTTTDNVVANGVIHHTGFIVAPPQKTLRDTIRNVSNLSYFRAAILRADSGAVVKPGGDSTNFINFLLGYPVTNMTILAPNDAAFQTLIYGLSFQGYLATRPTPYTATDSATANALATGAVAAGPAFLSTNNVTTALVKGIIAYHFLATNPTGAYQPNIRVFSVNVPSTQMFVKTLVNAGVAAHPGIMAKATYTGPFVSALAFSSYGSFPPGGAPFSYTANTLGMDRLAVNGIFHIIDKVLLPQ